MPSTNSRAGLALRALYQVPFFRLPLFAVVATALAFSVLLPAHRALAYTTLNFQIAPDGTTIAVPRPADLATTTDTGYFIGNTNSNTSASISGDTLEINAEGGTWGAVGTNGTFSIFWAPDGTITSCGGTAPNGSSTCWEAEALYGAKFTKTDGMWSQDGVTLSPPEYEEGINFGTYNTRFTSLLITASTSVPKDVHVYAEFFIDPDEVDRSKSSRNPTQVSVSIAQKPSTSFVTYSYNIGTTTGTSSIDMTILDGVIADSGEFDVLIQFSNSGVPFGSPRPFSEAYIYSGFTLTAKALTSFLTPEYNNALSTTAITTKPCGLTDIGGCFVNAFSYMLVPSTDTLENFQDTFDSIWTKSPFIYPAQISGYVSSLFPTGGGSFSIGLTTDIGSVTYLSNDILAGFPFASTLRTLMTYGLWFAFAMTVYRKVSMIHEKTV